MTFQVIFKLSIWTILFSILHTQKNPDILPLIKQFLKTKTFQKQILDRIIVGGSIDGYYSSQEFLEMTEHLVKNYPQFVSQPVEIGKTYKNEIIIAIQLGELSLFKRK